MSQRSHQTWIAATHANDVAPTVGRSVGRDRQVAYPDRPGFTLVELLVVIAIIGILVALLLPAVQSAREAGRRAQCRNHLKQIGLAFQMHHDVHNQLPTGGWGALWVGDADRGTNRRQPGGWIYNILPFVEQEPLWSMPADGQPDVVTNDQRTRADQLCMTPLALFNCPSRRPAEVSPGSPDWLFGNNLRKPPVAAHSDYAACDGEAISMAATLAPLFLHKEESFNWLDPIERGWNGICFQRSEVKIKDIVDGTSKTYAVGEKYLNPDNYATGLDPTDDQAMYCGDDSDVIRSTLHLYPPTPDRPGFIAAYSFGSAHPAGWHVVFCDGSVHLMSYSIDSDIHGRFGNREDGQVVVLE